MLKHSIVSLILVCVCASLGLAQPLKRSDTISFNEYNLSGPRLGVTYVGGGSLLDELEENNLGPILSQFGWHLEYQIKPAGAAPSFVIEFIPMIAGVEYGKFIPNASLAMGVRLPNGIEFGMGPTVSAGKDTVHTALLLALGKTFNYNGVHLPINLVLATSPSGNRFSFVFGYAINRRK
ncbi:MAG: hypothetical protein ACRBF0_23605 [Calditrichia bacterium]